MENCTIQAAICNVQGCSMKSSDVDLSTLTVHISDLQKGNRRIYSTSIHSCNITITLGRPRPAPFHIRFSFCVLFGSPRLFH